MARLGRVLVCLGASWAHLGGVLERLGASWGRLGGVLERLGASWGRLPPKKHRFPYGNHRFWRPLGGSKNGGFPYEKRPFWEGSNLQNLANKCRFDFLRKTNRNLRKPMVFNVFSMIFGGFPM